MKALALGVVVLLLERSYVFVCNIILGQSVSSEVFSKLLFSYVVSVGVATPIIATNNYLVSNSGCSKGFFNNKNILITICAVTLALLFVYFGGDNEGTDVYLTVLFYTTIYIVFGFARNYTLADKSTHKSLAYSLFALILSFGSIVTILGFDFVALIGLVYVLFPLVMLYRLIGFARNGEIDSARSDSASFGGFKPVSQIFLIACLGAPIQMILMLYINASTSEAGIIVYGIALQWLVIVSLLPSMSIRVALRYISEEDRKIQNATRHISFFVGGVAVLLVCLFSVYIPKIYGGYLGLEESIVSFSMAGWGLVCFQTLLNERIVNGFLQSSLVVSIAQGSMVLFSAFGLYEVYKEVYVIGYAMLFSYVMCTLFLIMTSGGKNCES